MKKPFSITVEKELLDGLDDFIDDFPRLTRSEAVETMIFYCLSHDDVLEDISDILEEDEEEEEESEDEDDEEEEDEE